MLIDEALDRYAEEMRAIYGGAKEVAHEVKKRVKR
jgi:hypothetical protein